jgi:hypothetical protein
MLLFMLNFLLVIETQNNKECKMKGILIYSLLTFNIILWLSFAGRSFCSFQKCSDGSSLVFS